MYLQCFITKNPLYYFYKKFIKSSCLSRIVCVVLLLYIIRLSLFAKRNGIFRNEIFTELTEFKRLYNSTREKIGENVNKYELDKDFDSNLPELRKRILKVSKSGQFRFHFENPYALYSNSLENARFTDVRKGSLNVYTWRDHCSESIDFLKVKLGFPYNPWSKSYTDAFRIIPSVEESGRRIFGYIFTPVSGTYSFKLTYYGSVEFWLSTDALPSHATKHEITTSNSIFPLFRKLLSRHEEYVSYTTALLVSNRTHYIEIIHTSNSRGLLEVRWKTPYSSEYEPVGPNHLQPFLNDSGPQVVSETYYPHTLPMHKPVAEVTKLLHPFDERNNIFSHSVLDINELGNSWVFPSCPYPPAFAERTPIKDANHLPLLKTYPSTALYSIIVEPRIFTAVISGSLMQRVLSIFMHHISHAQPTAQLSRLINMERLVDNENGDLFLVEVLITFEQNSYRQFLVSEYVVLGHRGFPKSILCRPESMKMQRDTFVHFLVTHRNFPQMVREFVQNMERIYEETGDENFGVIVVTNETPDINITALLRQSRLKRWSVIEAQGPWEKTAAINLGIDLVDISPDDIIFTTDLSLTMPSYLIDSIRKHTFQGFSGFAPIVYYFSCDVTIKSFYRGFYSITGYGLFSLFKSDWMKVGGMNTKLFKGKWGWEDNDLADRVLANGYVVFRMIMRDFYHQNHTYSGLWDDSG